MKMIIMYALFIVLGAIVLGFTLKERQVPAFTDDNCIRAIVGEYATSDYYGMKLIAHAIRNRRTLEGVYGFYAKHSDTESKEIWENATLAWFDSLNEFDPLNGVKDFGNWEDMKKYQRKGKGGNITKIYNGIYFYKPAQ